MKTLLYKRIKDSFKGHFLRHFKLCIRRSSEKDVERLKRRKEFENENFKNITVQYCIILRISYI